MPFSQLTRQPTNSALNISVGSSGGRPLSGQ